MTLAIHDIDLAGGIGNIWSPSLAGNTRGPQALLRAFNKQIDDTLGTTGGFLLRRAAGALHTAFGSEFDDEIADLATVLGAEERDVVVANLAYDLSHTVGCSTFVASTPEGPLHARNLDWPFPRGLLRTHTSVVRVHNAPAGEYAAVTWPGLFGVLTGVAPGRFAVTVNYVKHEEESDWKGLLVRAASGYWPVAWGVRRALDSAKTFDAAVRQLKSVPLLSPVLFTVSGVKDGVGVVIERSADSAVVRKISDGAVCVSNHYVSRKLSDSNVDLQLMDTEARLNHLEKAGSDVEDARGALRLLSSRQLLSPDTQHQVVMRARDGLLVVRVPGGRATTVRLQ